MFCPERLRLATVRPPENVLWATVVQLCWPVQVGDEDKVGLLAMLDDHVAGAPAPPEVKTCPEVPADPDNRTVVDRFTAELNVADEA